MPSVVTTLGLLAGWLSIYFSFLGHFDLAAICILSAAFIDAIDGPLARSWGYESSFGAIYDSISDTVSFTVAPAILISFWGLKDLGVIGWGAAFVFMASGGLRLARFSSSAGQKKDLRYFIGMPSPAAAGAISSFVWVLFMSFDKTPVWAVSAVALAAVLLGVLMVSPIPYRSFKAEVGKARPPLMIAVAMIAILALLAFDPALVLSSIALVYIASGFVHLGVRRLRGIRRQRGGGKNS